MAMASNIAAHLETVAPDGGIVVSSHVHDTVVGGLKASFRELPRRSARGSHGAHAPGLGPEPELCHGMVIGWLGLRLRWKTEDGRRPSAESHATQSTRVPLDFAMRAELHIVLAGAGGEPHLDGKVRGSANGDGHTAPARAEYFAHAHEVHACLDRSRKAPLFRRPSLSGDS